MDAIAIFTSVASAVILLISTVGNIILMIVLIKNCRRTCRGYVCLMFNLAVADLLLVFSCIPFSLVEKLKEPVFPFGELLCKLLWPFQTTTMMTSIFTVAMLSCQRYLMIVKPSKTYQKGNIVTILSTLTILWILPIITAAVPLAFFLELDEEEVCIETWSNRFRQYFTVYLTCIQYVLPLAVIAWCNGRAVIQLKIHSLHRKSCAILDSSILVRHHNVVRMLICIVAVFAIFWFPGQLAWLILTFSEGSEKWNSLLEISELFIFANSALNPLIFFAYNKEYSTQGSSTYLRKKVRKVTCRWRYDRKRSISEQAPELCE